MIILILMILTVVQSFTLTIIENIRKQHYADQNIRN